MRRVLPWIWTGVVLAGLIAWIRLDFPEDEIGFVLMFIAAVLLFTILGSLIATRQPGNRLSWLFWATGVGLVILGASEGLIETPPPAAPTAVEYVAFAFNNAGWIFTGMFYPFLLLMYLFPTGRFLSRRWTWAGWAGAVLIPATLMAGFLRDNFVITNDDDAWSVSNPVGFVPTDLAESVTELWFWAVFAISLGGVAAIVIRYRRSSLLVRTQIKWVVSSIVFAATGMMSLFTGLAAIAPEFVWTLWLMVGLALVPVSIAIAILRYKLFEIDRIISRTVSYVLVVGVLALVFAAGVTWIPTALGLGDSPLLVAGSTLAVAALFNPLRKRVQHLVDRRFNRSSYQAQLVSDEFGTRLQGSLTAEQLADVWTETVDQHLQPKASGVWLRDA